MAGAGVAHALALRGWAVTVLDACAEPAGGASGLPVGLVVPHVSADDSPRSRMSRNGTRLMLQHAQRLLIEGQDWACSGVMERRGAPEGDLWHPMAGWIKPARLVQEWLRHPGISFVGNARVRQLAYSEGFWTLHGDQGQPLAQAEHVVFANAYGCRELLHNVASNVELEGDVLAKSNTWHELHGLLSYGKCPADSQAPAGGMWPTGPVNGDGSFIPGIPTPQGPQWFAGSTFETQASHVADIAAQHRANYARLASLLSEVGAALAPDFSAGTVQAWSSTRCATHDRLPLVGPLQTNATPSLWINAGLGSRGLSFSALCAELLASQIHGEPLPVEAPLARGLHAMRARRQRRTTTQT
jgi:tRNA 5-methylaminomethyl-2-thiouridine biosynthesis bifunctional protein